MSAKFILGALIAALPFVVIAIAVVKLEGARAAFEAFSFTIAVVAPILIGVALMSGEL